MGAKEMMSLLKGFPAPSEEKVCIITATQLLCDGSVYTDFSRVLLRCGKGVTNQQWSTVGLVDGFLDPPWVQYFLLTHGDL